MSSSMKGKTYLEILGSQEAVDERKAKFLRAKQAKPDWTEKIVNSTIQQRKGKTLEEIYGEEKGSELRRKYSVSHIGKEPSNKGKTSPFKGKTYEEIGRGPSPLIGRKQSQEQRDSISKGHLKARGQTEPAPTRDGSLYQKWKTKVKQRDNYTCQNCGVQQKDLPRKINDPTSWVHAHHIKSWSDFPSLRFEVSNGITYCWPCHLLAENKKITPPDFVPSAVKVRKAPKKRGPGSSYVRTPEQLLAQKLHRLLLLALGAVKLCGGRPKGIPAWNKGKTNVEIYGEQKATELSKVAAENAKRTKNRLGTTTSPKALENIRLASKLRRIVTEVTTNKEPDSSYFGLPLESYELFGISN